MQKQSSHCALAVVGPTASGKSDIAIALAKKYNGEIVSCDSRQIYRGMDIGTGKVIPDQQPSTKNRQQETKNGRRVPENKSSIPTSNFQIPDSGEFFSEKIRHHMIDIVSANTPYSVAKFKKRADRVIRDILSRGKTPILCGGTGLWAQAVVENMSFPVILPDNELRNQLRNKTPEELFAKLKTLDPARAKTIDRHNPHRLIRAIEISSKITSSQQPTANNSQQEGEHKKYTPTAKFKLQTPPFLPTTYNLQPTTWLILAVNLDKEILSEKIERRLDKRLQEGMIAEVEALHRDARVAWTRLDAFGLEYRWISRYLRGAVSYEEMREKLLIDIRHYAKRQLTWLRRWERMGRSIHWVRSLSEATQTVERFLTKTA